jgi:uncharacterized protein YodC (DUF2158 family)
MKKAGLKVGDMVYSKLNGELSMMVSSIEGDEIECMWYNEVKRNFERFKFPPELLVRAIKDAGLKAGSRVRFKIGEKQIMTVNSVEGTEVECMWYNRAEDKAERSKFPPELLILDEDRQITDDPIGLLNDAISDCDHIIKGDKHPLPLNPYSDEKWNHAEAYAYYARKNLYRVIEAIEAREIMYVEDKA